MPRTAMPVVSPAGQQLLTSYALQLQEHQDLAGATQRNYLSDVGVTTFCAGNPR